MKSLKEFIVEWKFSNLDYNHTKKELVRSGLSLRAATKIVDIVLKYATARFNHDGDQYPDMSVVVYPKNAVGGNIGFIIYKLEVRQSRFRKIYDEVRRVLKTEKLNGLFSKQVATGYSFTWKKSLKEETIVEESPPDPKIEKWIKDNKERFKKEYGDTKGLEVLYAKAWKMYNEK